MKRIFVDTSGWYALVDANDPDHLAAKNWFVANKSPLVTSNYVFSETVTLIKSRLGAANTVRFGEKLRNSKFVSTCFLSDDDESAAWELFKKYVDKGYSFPDCTSFVLMRGFNIDSAFTFDVHFEQHGFMVLPNL